MFQGSVKELPVPEADNIKLRMETSDDTDYETESALGGSGGQPKPKSTTYLERRRPAASDVSSPAAGAGCRFNLLTASPLGL